MRAFLSMTVTKGAIPCTSVRRVFSVCMQMRLCCYNDQHDIRIVWERRFERLCMQLEESIKMHSLIFKSRETDQVCVRKSERAKFLQNRQHANGLYCRLNHCTTQPSLLLHHIARTLSIDCVQQLKILMVHKQIHRIFHAVKGRFIGCYSAIIKARKFKTHSSKSIYISISKSIHGQLVSLYQEER